MHSDIKDFLTTYGLKESDVTGTARRWNGTDHDDEEWFYYYLKLSPEYRYGNVIVEYCGHVQKVPAKTIVYGSVGLYLDLAYLNISLDQYAMAMETNGEDWEVYDRHMTRTLGGKFSQFIFFDREENEMAWKLDLDGGQTTHESFESALLFAEYQAGAESAVL